MRRILILGAYGLLGCSLSQSLLIKGHKVFRQGRSLDCDFQIDLHDKNELLDFSIEKEIEIIINLIAFTDVEKCESDIKTAYLVNVASVEHIVMSLNLMPIDKRPHLIHISTDHLYDGKGPHKEEIVRPCNVYGLTKYFAEIVAAKVNATILRTNFFGKSLAKNRSSFSDWIVNSVRDGQKINVYEDILFSPLSIETIGNLIHMIVMRPINGLFNLGCSEGKSKADFSYILLNELRISTASAVRVHSENLSNRIQRPLDMRMDSSLFENAYSCKLPTMESEIKSIAKVYRHG